MHAKHTICEVAGGQLTLSHSVKSLSEPHRVFPDAGRGPGQHCILWWAYMGNGGQALGNGGQVLGNGGQLFGKGGQVFGRYGQNLGNEIGPVCLVWQ